MFLKKIYCIYKQSGTDLIYTYNNIASLSIPTTSNNTIISLSFLPNEHVYYYAYPTEYAPL